MHFNTDGTHDYTLEPTGLETGYTYNQSGTLTAMHVTAPGGSSPAWTWTFAYTGGKLSSINDPAGRTFTVTVNGDNHLTQVAFPNGASRSFFYDADGLMTQQVDAEGHVTDYVYDQYGRISQHLAPQRLVYDPATGQTAPGRDERAFTTSETGYALINDSPVGDPDDPAPAVPTSTLLIDRVTYGRGGRSGHTNKWGYWLDETDGLSRTTTYQYDDDNNATKLTWPLSNCVEASYDEMGNPLTVARMGPDQCSLAPGQRDAGQVQTVTLTYEPRYNQTKSTTDPLGRTTTYYYDYELGVGEAGKLVRVEYPQVRDENGLLVTPTISYTYNSLGLMETETDERGTVTRYLYTQGTPTETFTGTNPLFAPGVTPVPGLLTQIVRDDGGLELTTTYQDFNAQGRALTVIRPGGRHVTRYLYDQMGRVISQTSPTGITTLYEYNGLDKLVRRVDDYTPDGVTGRNAVTEYSYDGEGQTVSRRKIVDGQATETRYAYDVNGKLAHQEDPRDNQTATTYDAADQVQATTDPLGNQTGYTYDSNGRQNTITRPNGTVEKSTYDGHGRLQCTYTNWEDDDYDPEKPDEDIQTCYGYDQVGNTILVTNTLSQTTRTWYDGRGRVLGRIGNWDGTTTLTGCLELPSVRDENACTLYAYDLAGNTVVVTDSLGRMTRTFYNPLGRVQATVRNWNPATLSSPDDCVLSPTNESDENVCTLYGYDDETGNRVTVTNALSQTNLTVYDEANRPIVEVANWDGSTVITQAAHCSFPPARPDTNLCTVTGYDERGRHSAITDTLGHVTEYGYDKQGRLITTTRYLDGQPVTTLSHYDVFGNRVGQTDARGSTTTYVYDGYGRLKTTASPEGVATTRGYDELGRVVTTTDSLGHASYVEYDDLGRRAATTDAEDHVTRYGYDSLSRQALITDARGTVTCQEYDGLGRLITVTQNYSTGLTDQETNVETQYAYNVLGQRVVITNARSVTNSFASYVYDDLGRAVEVGNALGYTTTTRYDALGQRTVVTDADGIVTRYSYDGMNRLSRVVYSGTITVTYRYDGLGRRTAMTDTHSTGSGQALGTITYAYDDLGRLITVTSPLTGAVGYRYDLAGNRTQLIYPDGKTVTYTYDADSRLTGVQDWDGGLTGYVYDVAGRLITTTLPNSVTTVRQYDDADRLVRLTHVATDTTTLSDFQYELDPVGNHSRVTETLTQTARVITNTFDRLNRLTDSDYSTGESFAYVYDPVGNREFVTSTTPLSGTIVTSYTYDFANRLTDQERSGDRAYTYTWSNRGQLLEEWVVGVTVAPVREFTYDAAGRMSQARVFTLTTHFTYNGDGARVKVEVEGHDTTTYTLDYAGGYRILAEETSTNTLTYLYPSTSLGAGGHDCLGQYEAAGDDWLYFLNDAPGYVRQGTDEVGRVTGSWLFDPDGTILAGPQDLVSHLICGGVYDWSTGLVYRDGRYFDPMLGIWLALMPLVVFQAWKGRKGRRGMPWLVLVLCLVGVGGSLVGCGGEEGERDFWKGECKKLPPPGPPSECTAMEQSGGEPPYEPDIWNDCAENQMCNACYSYALNIKMVCDWDEFHDPDLLEPGELGEAPYYENVSSPQEMLGKDNLTAAAVADGLSPILCDETCPEGTYKVALAVNSLYVDYHWYRQDKKGCWSHKIGNTFVTNYANGQVISDPRAPEARDFTEFGSENFDLFHGCFCAISRSI